MPCSVVSSMFEAVLTFLLANNADRPHPPQVVNPFPRYASHTRRPSRLALIRLSLRDWWCPPRKDAPGRISRDRASSRAVNLHPGRHGCELLLKADEIDSCAVGLEPCRSTALAPALLAGGLIGDGDGDGEQVLDTHVGSIAGDRPKEKGARRSERTRSTGSDAGLTPVCRQHHATTGRTARDRKQGPRRPKVLRCPKATQIQMRW
jgi:hypothetical protein